MKANVRKEAEKLLSVVAGKEVNKLRQEFERKGFLSKRELKILSSLSEQQRQL